MTFTKAMQFEMEFKDWEWTFEYYKDQVEGLSEALDFWRKEGFNGQNYLKAQELLIWWIGYADNAGWDW